VGRLAAGTAIKEKKEKKRKKEKKLSGFVVIKIKNRT